MHTPKRTNTRMRTVSRAAYPCAVPMVSQVDETWNVGIVEDLKDTIGTYTSIYLARCLGPQHVHARKRVVVLVTIFEKIVVVVLSICG